MLSMEELVRRTSRESLRCFGKRGPENQAPGSHASPGWLPACLNTASSLVKISFTSSRWAREVNEMTGFKPPAKPRPRGASPASLCFSKSHFARVWFSSSLPRPHPLVNVNAADTPSGGGEGGVRPSLSLQSEQPRFIFGEKETRTMSSFGSVLPTLDARLLG